MYDQVASTGLAALQQGVKMLAGAREGSDSLVGYTSPARVEPLALIDDQLLFSEAIPHVQQSLLSQVAGFYLQAAALSTTVGSVEVVKHLERLNPGRDGRATIVGHVLGLESYAERPKTTEDLVKIGMESYCSFEHRLPMPRDPRNKQVSVAMEADAAVVDGSTKDISNEIRQLTNLSVGKMINVKITDGKHSAVIPISIRLMCNSITQRGIIHILSAGSKDVSFSQRISQWRGGEIEFWRDLIFCTDLVDEHKKHLLNDKDGLYSAILSRRANNAVASLVSGNYSIATASNVVIISKDTAVEAEVELGLRLTDPKARQKVFEKTYMMIMAVVDTDRDRVTFYYRGIPDATSVSLRDLKASNKDSGPDIADILSAYRLGSSPSL